MEMSEIAMVINGVNLCALLVIAAAQWRLDRRIKRLEEDTKP